MSVLFNEAVNESIVFSIVLNELLHSQSNKDDKILNCRFAQCLFIYFYMLKSKILPAYKILEFRIKDMTQNEMIMVIDCVILRGILFSVLKPN